MSKTLEINGMTIKVVKKDEVDDFLLDDDKEMDNRAIQAVNAALSKAKVCKKPIAKYDPKTKKAYIVGSSGNIRYVK
jgi:hypothetical protein